MTQIQSHRLTNPAVIHKTSPNMGGEITPEIIVLHYTASGGKDGSGDASYLSRAASRASAHTVVGRDGSQYQLVPFNRAAWHAGKSIYKGRANVNDFSVGIEIDNWGWLTNGKSHAGANVPKSEIFEGTRSGKTQWESYKPAQLAAVEAQIAALCAEYHITDIVGHEDVSPGRKQDPGPALDAFMAKMKKKYLKKAQAQPKPKVTSTTTSRTRRSNVNGLNLREKPWTSATILSKIAKGEEMIELERDIPPGWSKVQRGQRIGFVSNKFLD